MKRFKDWIKRNNYALAEVLMGNKKYLRCNFCRWKRLVFDQKKGGLLETPDNSYQALRDHVYTHHSGRCEVQLFKILYETFDKIENTLSSEKVE